MVEDNYFRVRQTSERYTGNTRRASFRKFSMQQQHDILLRLPQVLARFPVSKSTWYAGIKTGRYPAPVHIAPRAVAWRSNDIQTLIDAGDIRLSNSWITITPNSQGDWINQRDNSFSQLISLGDKKNKDASVVFSMHSNGVITSRDAWVYSHGRKQLIANVRRMIGFYNSEVKRYEKMSLEAASSLDVDGFVNRDSSKISWGINLKKGLEKGITREIDEQRVIQSLYRPFTAQWLYADKNFNHSLYSMPKIFPGVSTPNRVICTTGKGEATGFSCLIADKIPNYHLIATGQCFPLYLYGGTDDFVDVSADGQHELLPLKVPANDNGDYIRHYALTDEGLTHFQLAYPTEQISKEDVFYYVYGLLHSDEYREKYADNLSKELPRIPQVKAAIDFWVFSNAGRDLADLHLNYEAVAMYPATIIGGGGANDEDYRVEKMKYGAKKDRTVLHYNSKITVKDIPLEAYEYVVNGKPALDWVVERQCVSTHKDSGIVNDANDWAIDTMHNPKYPLELFLRVITVSLETMKIVRALPSLELLEAAPTEELASTD